jgi:hypothetical protein
MTKIRITKNFVETQEGFAIAKQNIETLFKSERSKEWTERFLIELDTIRGYKGREVLLTYKTKEERDKDYEQLVNMK